MYDSTFFYEKGKIPKVQMGEYECYNKCKY